MSGCRMGDLEQNSASMVRAITECGRFRAAAAVTTGVVEELRRKQGTSPVATVALGRAITGAFLLASDLKGEERVMIQILGDGPLGEVFVEADSSGNGRGYVRNRYVDVPIEAEKIRIGQAVGSKGTLTVIKDLDLREPYRGIVPLTSGEIGKDLAYYLTVSEQIPSAVALGVYIEPDLTVKAAGGYLVQTLPGATDDSISLIERNIRRLPMPTELVRDGMSPEGILQNILDGFETRIIETQTLRFKCPCSDERVSRALTAAGPEELKALIEQEKNAEITCEFCRETYSYSQQDLRELLATATDPMKRKDG
jgi:molecular chaperone Hsp33